MRSGRIGAIASHLPQAVLGNDELSALYPAWSPDKIFQKTGVRERHIAAEDETAVDLAEAAARRLFDTADVAPDDIDFLIFCTQTPDHLLPASACILQARLGLRRDCGAFDYALGCSGFVYGLAMAQGLIATGAAERVLLLTCDTYSKLVHPMDRSVRTLFGDAAAATLIEAQPQGEAPAIGPFVFGTDGRGARNLIVPAGGARQPRTAETAAEATDAFGNVRAADNLFMDGGEIVAFALTAVPDAVRRLCERTGRAIGDYDVVVPHQASAFVLEKLRRKLGVDADRFVVRLERCGNTVSSSIPLALEGLMDARAPDRRAMLLGFGVGYSWAAADVMI